MLNISGQQEGNDVQDSGTNGELKCGAAKLIFPTLNDLNAAIETCNNSGYGNAAVLFTSNGSAAREFRHSVSAGMVGINIGVPAPMAFFPFAGWNNSFYGDLHVQGRESIAFFTQQKVTISRWAPIQKTIF